MKKILTVPLSLMLVGVFALSAGPVSAATWMIGDDDGYGIGIADNADHPFNGTDANYDGRSLAEASDTNGAQFTDTYSTTHPGYGPQPGTVATFIFDGLGSGWTEGSMWFDMADFQATTFGAVSTTYNGIQQNWAFNDGFPATKVRFFNLGQDVLDSINLLGSLTIVIDRSDSYDFYGFDYAMLSNKAAVPVPAAVWLFGSALVGLFGMKRQNSKSLVSST